MLSLHYSISKDDYINYYTYVMWDSPDKRKKHFFYYGQQLLTNAIIVVILLCSGLFNYRSSFLYIYMSILLMIVLLQFFAGRSKVKKQGDKITDDPYNASIFLDTLLEISETGIFRKDDTKETRYNWNAFIKKLENDDYYFLFLTKIDALIIPKKVFRSTAEKDSFDHLLTAYLSFDAELAHLIK
jgi:c-di-AMP phosphodiesterase-like protein